MDSICEAIGQERETVNAAKREEAGLIQGALQRMQQKGLQVYRHAHVELSRVPGAEKLRVRLTKEEGDAGVEDLEPPDGETGADQGGDQGQGDEGSGD